MEGESGEQVGGDLLVRKDECQDTSRIPYPYDFYVLEMKTTQVNVN